jgi:TPP-dependent pyruvate/acetoin dehydrogenase alpha subunit
VEITATHAADLASGGTGMAMAFKLRGEQRYALTWFGDGS